MDLILWLALLIDTTTPSFQVLLFAVQAGHLVGFLFALYRQFRVLVLIDYRVGLMFEDWKKEHGVTDPEKG